MNSLSQHSFFEECQHGLCHLRMAPVTRLQVRCLVGKECCAGRLLLAPGVQQLHTQEHRRGRSVVHASWTCWVTQLGFKGRLCTSCLWVRHGQPMQIGTRHAHQILQGNRVKLKGTKKKTSQLHVTPTHPASLHQHVRRLRCGGSDCIQHPHVVEQQRGLVVCRSRTSSGPGFFGRSVSIALSHDGLRRALYRQRQEHRRRHCRNESLQPGVLAATLGCGHCLGWFQLLVQSCRSPRVCVGHGARSL